MVLLIVCLLLMIPLSFYLDSYRKKIYIASIVKQKSDYGMKQSWRCAKCNSIILTNYRLTLMEYQNVSSPYAICTICAQTSICIDPDCITEEP